MRRAEMGGGKHQRWYGVAWLPSLGRGVLLLALMMLLALVSSCAQVPMDQGAARSTPSETAAQPAPEPAFQPREPPTDPILRVETGMHTAPMYRIATDAANRYLVTASIDKTVRVWDISVREKASLLRVLRPPIDAGREGRIASVAISPDGNTVACAGWTGWDWEKKTSIYLFDRATGAQTSRVSSLPATIHHLVYSPDGRFLVATLYGKNGIRLFRTSDYTLVAEDKEYGETSYGASFDPSGSHLATTSYDGFVRLYELPGPTAKGGEVSQNIAPSSKVRPPGGTQPHGIAFSPDGTRLAVGLYESSKVDVLEIRGAGLEYAFSPDTMGVSTNRDLFAVAWSSDGRFLYAAGNHPVGAVHQIRKWANAGRGYYKDLPGARNRVQHLISLRAGGVAYGAHDPAFGIYDARDQRTVLQDSVIADFRDNWDGFLFSPDGQTVQFSYEMLGKSLALFSLQDRKLADASSSLWASLKASFTFKAPITDGLNVTAWKYGYSPKLDGKPLPIKQHERAISLTITPDRSGFVLGCDWSIRFFDRTGKQLWERPAPGNTWGVNTNGSVAVGAFGDGTIRWFLLSDGKELMAFFPHNDRKRWVLWSPSGYYDASPGGEDLIGWHLNRGKHKEADFFPASRFRSTYYRPDVIDRVVATLDEAEALRLANEESGRKEVAASPVQEKLPPVVAILSPPDGSEVSTPSVNVRYSARSQDVVTGVKVLVDGRPVSVESGGKPSNEGGDLTVSIPQRDCEVSVIAENRHAASEPATVRLRWKGAKPKEDEFQIKPKLYVLAVGVSQYQDSEIRLDLAAKDALDFGAAWNEQRGRLYSGVEVRALTDAQATKGNILDGLEWLQRQTTSKDVAVLFFAGHGINDPTGIFYFLPVDADLEKLKRTGLSQADITSTVATIAGKVLVFMDACHSGNIMGKVKRRGQLDMSAVINELAAAENGAIVFSSSTGRQYSLENPEWGNGAFTKGLVEGIGGKADFRGTGRITVTMLDLYVSERVKELTKGQQTPATVKPPNIPDFPVAVVVR